MITMHNLDLGKVAVVDEYGRVVEEVSRDVIGELKPSERNLVEDVLALRHRRRRLRTSRAVGFGVPEAVDFLSEPVVAAVGWYARIWFDEGKSVVESGTRRLVRKLRNRKGDQDAPTPPARPKGIDLSPEELSEHVRAVKLFMVAMGLDEAKADPAAAAIVAFTLALIRKKSAEELADG